MNLLQAAKLIPWLKGQVEKFLPVAQRNRDPELYANVLLEELPEDQDPATLMQFIERPDWFDWLKSLDPRVANFPQWFAQLRAHLIRYLKEELAAPSGAAIPETAQVPVGKFAGQRVPVVHVDGGSVAQEPPSEDSAAPQVQTAAAQPPEPPSLTKRGL